MNRIGPHSPMEKIEKVLSSPLMGELAII